MPISYNIPVQTQHTGVTTPENYDIQTNHPATVIER